MRKEEFNNFINLNVDTSGGMKPYNEIVYAEYSWKGGNCVQLDKKIKDVRDRAVAVRLNTDTDEKYIQALVDYRNVLESLFASNSCADKIETLRQKETGTLITKTSIDQEKKVLGSSKTEQNIYIGVGSLCLLVSLIILVKK